MSARFVPLDRTLALLSFVEAGNAAAVPFAQATARLIGWAMIEDAQLLGAGGVVPIWYGRALAWLQVTPAARPRHVALACRYAEQWFDTLQDDAAFRRIEATALAGARRACAFLERLGFSNEGELRRYGPDGADHVLYARVA